MRTLSLSHPNVVGSCHDMHVYEDFLFWRYTKLTNSLVFSIQHYVIKFINDLRQVGGFPRYPPSIDLKSTM
jgi:hypothetical protein